MYFILFYFFRNIEDEICLLIYRIQSSANVVVEKEICRLSEDDLFNAIMPYWLIYFDTTTSRSGNRFTSFSEFAAFSISSSNIKDNNDQADDEFLNLSSAFLLILMYLLSEQTISLHVLVCMFTDYITSNIGTNNCHKGQQILKLLLEKFFTDYFNISCEINICLKNTIGSPLSTASESSELCSISSMITKEHEVNCNRKCFLEVLLILLRIYLDEWRKISDKLLPYHLCSYSINNQSCNNFSFLENSKEKRNLEDNLFGKRYAYLNFVWPFYGNSISTNIPEKYLKQLQIILQKIQSLLCLNAFCKRMYEEVHCFLNINKELYGVEGVIACISEPREACNVLLESAPQSLQILGRERFTIHKDWSFLIDIFTLKIQANDKKNEYMDIFNGEYIDIIY